MSGTVDKDTEFLRAYRRLSLSGYCDAPEGAEYERVKGEWIAAGRPIPMLFIRARANVGPLVN